jgi:hypothetical protein
MRYCWIYFLDVYPRIFFLITFGVFSPLYLGWRYIFVKWVINIFYVLDVLPIVLSFGKITSCWHSKAGSLFFEMNLYELACDKNPQWSKCLFFTTYRVLVSPDMF